MKYQQRPILGVISPRVQSPQGTEPQPALSHFYLLLGYSQPQAFTSSLRRRTLFEAFPGVAPTGPQYEGSGRDCGSPGCRGSSTSSSGWSSSFALCAHSQGGVGPGHGAHFSRTTATECQSLRLGDHEKALGSQFSPDDSSRFLVHMSHLSVLPNCLVWPTSGPDTRCKRNGPF